MQLKPGTYRYRTKVESRGREMTLENLVAIVELDECWSVVESSEMPPSSDAALLEKHTLALKTRRLAAGPSTLEVTVSDGTISGTFVAMHGQTRAIAALPLEDGFTDTFRGFETATQTPLAYELSVSEADPRLFRVDIAPGEWILFVDRETKHVVRMSRSVKGMAMNAELISFSPNTPA